MSANSFFFRPNFLAWIACVSLIAGACEEGGMIDLYEQSHDDDIARTAFTLTDSLGAYGKELQSQGLELTKIGKIEDVPTTPQTLVYMNAEETIDLDLGDFLTQFRGILVVDSNDLYPAESEEALSGDEVDELEEGGQGAKASETYINLTSDLPGGMAGFAPGGTAIVVSMNSERFIPLMFGEDGKNNGGSRDEMKDILDLKGFVARNVEARPTPRNNPLPNSDRWVDLNKVVDGYRAVAVIAVNAYAKRREANATKCLEEEYK